VLKKTDSEMRALNGKTQDKKTRGKRFAGKLHFMIILAVVVIFGYLTIGNLAGIARTQVRTDEALKKLQAEERKAAEINLEIENINSDLFIEKIAREIGLVMPDEIVFVRRK